MSTATPKVTKTATKKTNTPTPAPAPVIYCGPTIKGIVRQYTAFPAGLPTPVQKLVSRYPLIEALIVPVDEFAKTKKALNTPDTAEALIFEKITFYLKGGK